MKTKHVIQLFICLVVIIGFNNCSSDTELEPFIESIELDEITSIVDGDFDENSNVIQSTSYSSRTVNFDNWTDGAYTQSRANTDFGNFSGVNSSLMSISNKTLRVKLLKNSSGGSSDGGGVVGRINIPEGTKYEVNFSVRFHSAFNFVKGGKVGFGLLLGTGNTGGNKPTGTGGSVRAIWKKETNGDITLKPYVYHYDQPGQYGESFGARYPASGSIQRGVWYPIRISVFSNNGTSKDGVSYMKVADQTILYKKDTRYTTNNSYRKINKISFACFYGGNGKEWESSTDGLIYIDNVFFKRNAL